MYTEDEAHTKRCCGPVGCGGNSFGDNTADRYCTASECMAWALPKQQAKSHTEQKTAKQLWLHCRRQVLDIAG